MALSGSSTTLITRSPGISPYFPLTISCWVWAPSGYGAHGTDYFLDVSLVDGSTTCDFNPHLVGNGSFYQFGINIANSLVGTWDYASSYQDYVTGWIHWCATFADNGTAGTLGTVKEYINGDYASPSTSPGTITFINNDSESTIQLQPGASSGLLYLAYPAVWKTILTPSQVACLANGSPASSIAASYLVAGANLSSTSSNVDIVDSSKSWVVSGPAATLQTDPSQAGTSSHIAQTTYASGGSSVTSLTATFDNAAQISGNTNAVVLIYNGGSSITATVSDNANGSYTKAVGPIVSTSGNAVGYIYYKSSIVSDAAGSNTVTATFSGSGASNPEMLCVEMSGINGLDVTGSEKTTTNSGSGSVAVTTLNANDLILTGFCNNSNGWTGAGSGFTLLAKHANSGNIFDFRTTTSTGTYTDTPSASSNSEWIAVAAAFSMPAPVLPTLKAASSSSYTRTVSNLPYDSTTDTYDSYFDDFDGTYTPELVLRPTLVASSSSSATKLYELRPTTFPESSSSFAQGGRLILRPTLLAQSSSSATQGYRLVTERNLLASTSSSATQADKLILRPQLLASSSSSYANGDKLVLRPDATASSTSSASASPRLVTERNLLASSSSSATRINRLVLRPTLVAQSSSSYVNGDKVVLRPDLIATSSSSSTINPEETNPYVLYGRSSSSATQGQHLVIRPQLLAAASSSYTNGVKLVLRAQNVVAVSSSSANNSNRFVYRPNVIAATSTSAATESGKLYFNPGLIATGISSFGEIIRLAGGSGSNSPGMLPSSMSSATMAVELRLCPTLIASSNSLFDGAPVVFPRSKGSTTSSTAISPELIIRPRPNTFATSSSSAGVNANNVLRIIISASSSSSATTVEELTLRPNIISLSSSSSRSGDKLVIRTMMMAGSASLMSGIARLVIRPKLTGATSSSGFEHISGSVLPHVLIGFSNSGFVSNPRLVIRPDFIAVSRSSMTGSPRLFIRPNIIAKSASNALGLEKLILRTVMISSSGSAGISHGEILATRYPWTALSSSGASVQPRTVVRQTLMALSVSSALEGMIFREILNYLSQSEANITPRIVQEAHMLASSVSHMTESTHSSIVRASLIAHSQSAFNSVPTSFIQTLNGGGNTPGIVTLEDATAPELNPFVTPIVITIPQA